MARIQSNGQHAAKWPEKDITVVFFLFLAFTAIHCHSSKRLHDRSDSTPDCFARRWLRLAAKRVDGSGAGAKRRAAAPAENAAIPSVGGNEYLDIFSQDGIEVKVATQKFDKNKHKIIYTKKFGVTKIDGFDPYGVDYDLPKYEYKSIEVTINGKKAL